MKISPAAIIDALHEAMRDDPTTTRHQMRNETPRLIEAGYTIAEIRDVLTDEGLSSDEIDDEIKRAKPGDAKPKKYLIPESYDEVQPLFEKMLGELGPNQFVRLLTEKVIPVGAKGVKHLQILADRASADSNHLRELHEFIGNYVEDWLYRCMQEAKREPGEVVAQGDGQYAVRIASASESIVNVRKGTSTSEIYREANLELFGLADPDMFRVNFHVCPYERIRKDLS